MEVLKSKEIDGRVGGRGYSLWSERESGSGIERVNNLKGLEILGSESRADVLS